jgi:hypothetical protein
MLLQNIGSLKIFPSFFVWGFMINYMLYTFQIDDSENLGEILNLY